MKTKEALHWEKWNSDHRKQGLNETTLKLGRAVLDAFDSFTFSGRPSTLEVACGTGWLAPHLLAQGEYRGIDLAPSAIEAAKERLPDVSFEASDFSTWEMPDSTFDVIICVDAIACFHEQHLAMQKFVHGLKPGGKLILTTVNPFVYSRIWWVKPPGEGQARKWLTRNALHALVEGHGFIIDKSWTILPDGDQGILRLINGRIANKIAGIFVPPHILSRWKEKLGLGQFRVLVAHLAEKRSG